jgi:plastocyanin
LSRRPLVALAAAVAALAPAAPARAEVFFVGMEFESFSPAHLDLLVGDSVSWRNGSLREHDVASTAAGFDSGRVGQGGSFAHTFDSPGVFPYVCRIHDPMKGEVAVHPLLLSGPRRVVARDAAVALHVRAPAGVRSATIEEDSGTGFRPVATATPQAGPGHEDQETATLHATVRPAASATYRAVSGGGASPPLRIEVTDQASIALAASGRPGGAVLRARAVPAQPRARVILQLRLRERFGWWTVKRSHLDRRSRARFVLRRRRPVRARVALVGADWVTTLAASQPIVVRPRRG